MGQDQVVLNDIDLLTPGKSLTKHGRMSFSIFVSTILINFPLNLCQNYCFLRLIWEGYKVNRPKSWYFDREVYGVSNKFLFWGFRKAFQINQWFYAFAGARCRQLYIITTFTYSTTCAQCTFLNIHILTQISSYVLSGVLLCIQ